MHGSVEQLNWSLTTDLQDGNRENKNYAWNAILYPKSQLPLSHPIQQSYISEFFLNNPPTMSQTFKYMSLCGTFSSIPQKYESTEPILSNWTAVSVWIQMLLQD